MLARGLNPSEAGVRLRLSLRARVRTQRGQGEFPGAWHYFDRAVDLRVIDVEKLQRRRRAIGRGCQLVAQLPFNKRPFVLELLARNLEAGLAGNEGLQRFEQ